jgi:hypothetical protein
LLNEVFQIDDAQIIRLSLQDLVTSKDSANKKEEKTSEKN